MSGSTTRLLALGLDATSPELIDRWTRDGTMPVLRALIDRGLSGPVHGVEGFFVGSTWPSLYTGVDPARHGVHYELQLVPGTYDLHRVQHGAFVRAEPIWSALARQGRRVAALDVPLGAPTGVIDGIQVVDWGGHDVLFGLQTQPPELRRWILDRFGPHPHGPTCDVRRSGIEDYREFVERQEGAVPVKLAWTRALLERGGWDLFLQVFTEGHCVGHQCWHLHDPTHPAHDRAIAAALGDPLRRIYGALDRAVGELVESAAGAQVLVWSGHGMSFWRGAHFLLPDILVRLGVCEPASEPGESEPWARRAAGAAWRRLPDRARAPVRRLRDTLAPAEPPSRTTGVPALAADAARSLCFPVPNGTAASGIRLNLAGREPAGRIGAGDADGFCAELTESLLQIIDERTGRPLVDRVIRTRDLYEGPHLDLLPDLLVEWSADVPTGSAIVSDGAAARVRISSPRIGRLEGANRFGRTGGHRAGGWFVLAGPGIEAGRLEQGMTAFDVAPTMAALLGAEMPGATGSPVVRTRNS